MTNFFGKRTSKLQVATRPNYVKILTGSPLQIGRRALACGIIRTEVGNYIIVTGGYNGAYMDSTEIMKPKSNVWERGPFLPLGITDAAMVEDPRTSSVLLVCQLHANQFNSIQFNSFIDPKCMQYNHFKCLQYSYTRVPWQ